jgi:hypothetical protein
VNVDDRVATQEELAKFRAVMQVHAAHGVIQIEKPTIWQRLAPQELVVPLKSGAERVRIPSRRVSPEVKRRVDQHSAFERRGVTKEFRKNSTVFLGDSVKREFSSTNCYRCF